jgi:hypothetical protein
MTDAAPQNTPQPSAQSTQQITEALRHKTISRIDVAHALIVRIELHMGPHASRPCHSNWLFTDVATAQTKQTCAQ